LGVEAVVLGAVGAVVARVLADGGPAVVAIAHLRPGRLLGHAVNGADHFVFILGEVGTVEARAFLASALAVGHGVGSIQLGAEVRLVLLAPQASLGTLAVDAVCQGADSDLISAVVATEGDGLDECLLVTGRCHADALSVASLRGRLDLHLIASALRKWIALVGAGTIGLIILALLTTFEGFFLGRVLRSDESNESEEKSGTLHFFL